MAPARTRPGARRLEPPYEHVELKTPGVGSVFFLCYFFFRTDADNTEKRKVLLGLLRTFRLAET